MSANVTYINVNDLYPHKDNPRKDVGDLEELTASIKVSGVLQPLTVVPRAEGGYTVVIGHRRRAAAVEAGVAELPCIITDLSETDQLGVMLQENMQRENLTPVEEAFGFQTMLDLGKSVKDIAKETGFTQTTIKKRVKVASIDKTVANTAVEKGATIDELVKASEIEDVDIRNKFLEENAGTRNFDYRLKDALEEQENKKKFAILEHQIKQWATKIETREGKRYVKCIGLKDSAVRPTEYLGQEMFYEMPRSFGSWQSIDIYVNASAVIKPEDEAAKEELRKRMNEATEKRREFISRRSELVKDFLKGLTEKEIEKEKASVCSFAVPFLMTNQIYGDVSDVAEALGIKKKDGAYGMDALEGFAEKCGQSPLKTMLLTAACYSPIKNAHITTDWHDSYSLPVFDEKSRTGGFYELIEKLGYQTSDEEKAVMDGTHEMFAIQKELKAKEEAAKKAAREAAKAATKKAAENKAA